MSHLFSMHLLQVTETTEVVVNNIPSLGTVILKGFLIILVLALASGFLNYTKADTLKKKAFIKGFLTVFVISAALLIMFGILAYIVGLQVS